MNKKKFLLYTFALTIIIFITGCSTKNVPSSTNIVTESENEVKTEEDEKNQLAHTHKSEDSLYDSKEYNVPILMYHHFSTKDEEISSATMKPETFESHLDLINELGFTTISFKDLNDMLSRKKEMPENPIILTFDDGYKSNYIYVYPALKDRQMKGTINIIGCVVGLDTWHDGTPLIPYLTWEEINEMKNSTLIEIGSHTYAMHTHDDFNDRKGVYSKDFESVPEYEASLEKDAICMEEAMIDNLGSKPIVLAYPYGYHTEASEKLAKEKGYLFTLDTATGSNTLVDEEATAYLLKRNNVDGAITLDQFKSMLLTLREGE